MGKAISLAVYPRVLVVLGVFHAWHGVWFRRAFGELLFGADREQIQEVNERASIDKWRLYDIKPVLL